MKTLLIVLLVFMCFMARAANPSYEAFLGTNGIVIRSNPPQGKVIIDGRDLTNGLGTGTVAFSDLVWTNDGSSVRLVAPPTTFRLWPVNIGANDPGPGFIMGTSASNWMFNFGANQQDYSIITVRDVEAGGQLRNHIATAAGQNSAATRYGYAGLEVTTNTSRILTEVNITGSGLQQFTAGHTASGSGILLRTNSVEAFKVDGAGGIVEMKGVDQNWPAVQGAAGTALTNDGAGNLGWWPPAGGGISAALRFTNQLWVELRGNDATGVRNDPAFPFQTITNAIKAALPGDVVNIGVGRFTNVPPGIIVSNGVTLRGVDWNNTVLCFTNDHSTHGPNLKPQDNTTIEHLRLEVAAHLGSLVSAPFGVHESFDSFGFTNVTVRNVRMVGFSDVIIIVQTDRWCQADFYDCELESNADLVVQHGSTTNRLRFKNCYFKATGPVAPATTVRLLNMSEGLVLYDQCSLLATNNGANVDGLNLLGGRARLENSTMQTYSTSGTTNAVTTAGSGKVELYNCFIPTNAMSGNVMVDPPWVSGVSAGANVTITTNSSHVVTISIPTPATGILSGTTNFMNLSVQAIKLPATNMPSIDGSWTGWETVFAETNAEGSRATLGGNYQFMVPTDYATNSLKLLINYSLLGTNGPNTSNVVWGASILPVRSGTTNNVHTNLFGTTVKGSNDWIAKYDGTNIVTNLVLDLSVNSLLMPRDLSIIKIERFATEDTYGGAVALHGLQLEYTRP